MSKRIKIGIAGLVAVAAVAVGASGAAGAFVVNDHTQGFHTYGPFPRDWCGEVPGSMTATSVVQHKEDASGNFIETERFTGVFTAAATGKSLLTSGAGVVKVEIIDNGDGTTTYVSSGGGLSLQFKVPNGPILKDASGRPILGAGEFTSVETVDNATNQTISLTGSFHGPHPMSEGVDICGPTVAYLLG
jgi:hypothetical protein